MRKHMKLTAIALAALFLITLGSCEKEEQEPEQNCIITGQKTTSTDGNNETVTNSYYTYDDAGRLIEMGGDTYRIVVTYNEQGKPGRLDFIMDGGAPNWREITWTDNQAEVTFHDSISIQPHPFKHVYIFNGEQMIRMETHNRFNENNFYLAMYDELTWENGNIVKDETYIVSWAKDFLVGDPHDFIRENKWPSTDAQLISKESQSDFVLNRTRFYTHDNKKNPRLPHNNVNQVLWSTVYDFSKNNLTTLDVVPEEGDNSQSNYSFTYNSSGYPIEKQWTSNNKEYKSEIMYVCEDR